VKFSLSIACVFLFLFAPSARALEADELVLIVNANIPASVQSAEFYAKARLVPAGRIISLSLPASEEISFDKYEKEIVPAVRTFLRTRGLDQKVKCAVTFFGVPFRISSRQITPKEADERAALERELTATAAKTMPFVLDAEKIATDLNPNFSPRVGLDPGDLPLRANHALADVGKHLPPASDPRHIQLLPQLLKLMQTFGGDAQVADKISNDAEVSALLPPTQASRWPARRTELAAANQEVTTLHDRRYDPEARKRLRELLNENFGLFGVIGCLQAQIDYLTTDGTVSALDNEIALLWWNYYPRQKWQGNPLYYRYVGEHPPMLMVTRLDGPQEGSANQIVLGSLKAERDGLKGRVVIDSTGGTAPDGSADRGGGYREFDTKLLNLAELLRAHTKLPITLDRKPGVLPAHSINDVAIYAGWYSVRNYVPACTFKAGAVAIHIASFEMISLRSDNEKGWVAGLINDGVCATVGAVAEPYLSAFPSPDEFFPLLLTGKLTLAEVYWKTTPMTSWMMTCIGDPLYTPFKNDPPLKLEDLRAELRGAVEGKPAASQGAPGLRETPPPAL
jgi:uncharacterized protein (TIGR03790 family)